MDGSSSAPPLEVVVDVGAVPTAAAWAEGAAARCRGWYPTVDRLLRTPGFSPPRRIVLRVVPRIGPGPGPGTPGVTSGTVITVGAAWMGDHPDDIGLVLHELVHVVQAYPRGDPWWVTEGIADWVRYHWAERHDPRARPDLDGRSPREGYAVTAALLAWVETQVAPGFVRALNDAMRNGSFTERLVERHTGADLDTLWRRFRREGGAGGQPALP